MNSHEGLLKLAWHRERVRFLQFAPPDSPMSLITEIWNWFKDNGGKIGICGCCSLGYSGTAGLDNRDRNAKMSKYMSCGRMSLGKASMSAQRTIGSTSGRGVAHRNEKAADMSSVSDVIMHLSSTLGIPLR